MAVGGEVVIYAPHLDVVSHVHGKYIYEVGYHVLPYFLNDWERFKHVPLGVLAHSTHVRGSGVMVNGIEKANVRVTLASKISPEDCARLNLGYLDPATIKLAEWEPRGGRNPRRATGGEMLYKIRRKRMNYGLNLKPGWRRLDLVSLGALVHRLDPGIIPFRKATECRHPRQRRRVQRGREPGRLLRPADGHRHGDGGLPHRRPDRRARAGDGRHPLLQALRAQRRERPEHGHGLQRPRAGRARAGGLLQPRQRGRSAAQAGRLRLEGDLRRRRALVPQRRHLRRAVRRPRARSSSKG